MKAKEDRQEDDPEALKGGVVNSGRKNIFDRVMGLAGEAKDKISSFFGDGDSDVDIETAKNAGMPCVSVLWGFRDKEFLAEHGAEYYAETAEDVLRYIKEMK
jgi:ribonucleotide monophosphatase NagD (HAD superfamily)